MSKPTELWLIENKNEIDTSFECLAFKHKPIHGAIKYMVTHVIEYSAYEKLQTSNKALSKELHGMIELIDALVEDPDPDWTVQMIHAGVKGCCLTTKPGILEVLKTHGTKPGERVLQREFILPPDLSPHKPVGWVQPILHISQLGFDCGERLINNIQGKVHIVTRGYQGRCKGQHISHRGLEAKSPG